MKNVRLVYTRKGRLRFVSHLDMNRFMSRVIKRSRLPVWYTEGFNPHAYITFALPLSLGFESEYEILDIKLVDDNFDIAKIPDILNGICGEYINFFDVFEPTLKTGLIAAASYEISFDDGGEIFDKLSDFLKQDSIICSKKTKKGDIKQLDIAQKIKNMKIEQSDNNTVLHLTLPSGSEENLNPELLITAFYEANQKEYYCYNVLRTAVLDKEGKLFR
ncbi:MAG: DUF2344 domain-containing protein [Clostridia bacterium]|nr:DUF2344 domain-containing protein [Clostridia bacterium]